MNQRTQIIDVLLENIAARYAQHQTDGMHLGRVDRLVLPDKLPHDILGRITGLQARNDEIQGHCCPQRQQEEQETSNEVAHRRFSFIITYYFLSSEYFRSE